MKKPTRQKTMQAIDTASRSGRPRDRQADQAILSATIDELSVSGYENLSFESVARRCGSSRSTIYRRYTNKADLAVAAVTSAFERANPVVPDSGDTRQDLVTLLFNTSRMLTDTPVGTVFRGIIRALHEDERLSSLAAGLEKDRRELLIAVLKRGQQESRIDKGDIDIWIDAMLGAIYLRFLLLPKPVDRRYIESLVEEVIFWR